jgi:hypothetical protein
MAHALVHIPPGNVRLQVRPVVQSASIVHGEPICFGLGPASTGVPVSEIVLESSPGPPESIPLVDASCIVPVGVLLHAATTKSPEVNAQTAARTEFSPAMYLAPSRRG